MTLPQTVHCTYLRVDPIACDGVGICSHIADDSITVDSWGYPIVDRRPLDEKGLRKARAAIAACPRKALYLESDE